MTERHDRRAFLRRLAAMGFAMPTVSALGCSLEEITRQEGEMGFTDPSIERPVLLPWTDEAVQIRASLSSLPLAYVSRGLQRVYVDLETRFELRGLLAAHISVSSGHWRIPLAGDDLGIPIDAGDPLREFEEWPVAEWDSTLEPTEGDVRIRRGVSEKVSVAFDCLPMAEREGWFSAGPWDIEQCTGTGRQLCREQFMEIGVGTHHTSRPLGACGEAIGSVRYVTWACPDPPRPVLRLAERRSRSGLRDA